jgi:hypothetical protein
MSELFECVLSLPHWTEMLDTRWIVWNFAKSNKDTCAAWANYGIINDLIKLLLNEDAEEFKNKHKPNTSITAIHYALYSCGAQPVFVVTHRPAGYSTDYVDQHD